MEKRPMRSGPADAVSRHRQSPTFSEWLIYLAIVVITVIGVALAQFAPDILTQVYLVEDGVLEWLSVVLLLFLAIICLRRALGLRRIRPKAFTTALLLVALGFFFVAGEEVSWGQRIFAIETPDWLSERNQQGEFNVHNLVVGDFSVNKVIFGNLLTLVLFLYIVPLPILAHRSPRIDRMVGRIGVPLPTLLQSLLFFPAAFIPELLIDAAESDEIVETCGLLMLVAIFLWPKNPHIYDPNWRPVDEYVA
ncbi:MAG: hypothetical protein AAGF88_09500 [Pseudomonadota bacterium]